jgi:hypothetical protein
MGDENIDPIAEAKAMQELAEVFKGLQPDAIRRVLRWATDVYGAKVVPAPSGAPAAVTANSSNSTASQFTDVGELFAAASPTTDADKALVVGYWFQYVEGQSDLNSQAINTALKHLGHSIGNITTAFDNLKARRPAPVIQLKKSGTSKQARKTYRLTSAGKTAVELMIGQSA